jgi:hypothetical protein
MKGILLALLVGTATITGQAAPKPKAITVKKIRAMSHIAEFTLEELQYLSLVSDSPRMTRDALLKMHMSRVDRLRDFLFRLPVLDYRERAEVINETGMGLETLQRNLEFQVRMLEKEADALRALKL